MLENKNFEYKRELRKGSYHNEGYIDIVVKKDNIFYAIEAKIKNYRAVLFQAIGNLVRNKYSIILYLRKPNNNLFNLTIEYGIGLIVYTNETFKMILKPKTSKYIISNHHSKIIRNWNENRCGRKLNKNEIPKNYDVRKLKKLECKYEW